MSGASVDLQALIMACFRSPEDAHELERLDSELRPNLLAILASLGSNGVDLIEDAYQSAFVKYIRLFRKGPRPGINYEAYFVAIAKNCLFDLLNERRRLVTIDEVLESDFAIAPHDETARTEARITIWQALAKLDRPCQFLLERYYLEDRTSEELAEEAGIARETLHVRLHRCRERLRAVLSPSERR